tara:strand:- start:4159 stop:4605 length:447 start_codon:yes stop_codon:yes gene_type:complete
MADQKLSQLTAATSIAGTDTVYIVSGSASKQITLANLFAAVPTPANFTSKFSIGGVETLTAAGDVSVATNITYLSNPATAGTLTIGVGTEGQIKIILMIANSGSNTLTLDDSDVASDTVAFSNVGDTATLIYTNSKWYIIGGTATVTA